jgi:DNA-directed RNA polymerase sigma subunit (sigma70/sigma32)
MEIAGEKIAAQMVPIMTRKEVGKIMGCSSERIRQIERLALGKIASRLLESTELRERLDL